MASCFERVCHFKSTFTDEVINVDCEWKRSRRSGLNVIICQVPSECVYGTFVFLTDVKSNKPLAACVQRMIWCGSENFPPNFVERVGREISLAFAGAIPYPDRSVYTINAENDLGLIALLPPYLDALFRPSMNENDFREQIYCAKNSKGRQAGEMYKTLVSNEQLEFKSMNDIEQEIYPESSPYHYNFRGTSQALAQVTLAEVKEYHKHFYRPSNCYVILAGLIHADDVLEVLASFESHLPKAMLEYSLANPAKIIAPAQPPTLIQPQQELPAPDSPLPMQRQQTYALNSVVRFSSEVLEVERAKLSSALSEEKVCHEPRFDIHIAVQGPDLLRHEEWTAFTFLARIIKDKVAELNGDGDRDYLDPSFLGKLSVDTAERKWPLATFTLRDVPHNEVKYTRDRYADLIEKFVTKGDPLCICERKTMARLLDAAVEEYREALSWRAEYNVVTSLSLWVASCKLTDDQAKESFYAALHPAVDFRKLKKMSASWWADFLRKHFSSYVSLIEPSKVTFGGPERFLDSCRRSSRWTLSSAASDRDVPRDCKEMRECHWEIDGTVEAYFESIGGREILQGWRAS